MLTVRHCLVLCGLTLLVGCEPSPNQPTETAAHSLSTPQPERDSFVAYLGLKAYTDISIASQSAQEFDAQLSKFLYHPNAASLTKTQDAWRVAYNDFLKTLIYANLPLADPAEWHKKGIDYQQTLVQLDSWPIEGGYIDFVPGYPFSGIVNDLALPLTADSLLTQHGFADPTYASLGFHALEFMLWGQEGQRQPSDFLARDNTTAVIGKDDGNLFTASSNLTPEQVNDNSPTGRALVQNQHRRRQYIQLVSEQLQKHLHRLQRRFEPSNGYYATRIQASSPDTVVKATLVATQKLISEELLGKRLNGQSSPFSQSSWADNRAIVQGIFDLYLPNQQQDTPQGLSSLLPETAMPLLGQWQLQLENTQICFAAGAGQPAGKVHIEDRQLCRQRLIELLSLLKKTADTLELDLPNLN